MEQLEVFHRKCLRHIQSLPDRTSNSAVLLLLGALPIEAEIHKRQPSLLYSTLSCNNERIKEVMDRQICTNYDNKQSFFCKVLELIQMYDMPWSIQALENSLPKKYIGKEKSIKKLIISGRKISRRGWKQVKFEVSQYQESRNWKKFKCMEFTPGTEIWNE